MSDKQKSPRTLFRSSRMQGGAAHERSKNGRDHLAVALVLMLATTSMYLFITCAGLLDTLADPEAVEYMTGQDSHKYLKVASRFVIGEYQMYYLDYFPRRQPLYPALLAATTLLFGDDLFYQASVNIVVGLVTLWVLFFGFRAIFGFSLAAVAAPVSYVSLDWLLTGLESITVRLLTEPVFILLVLAVLIFLTLYVNTRRPIHFYAMCVAAALVYLTRMNGLFMIPTLMLVVGVFDFYRSRADEPAARGKPDARLWHSRKFVYAAGFAIIAVMTTPSTVPRALLLGNPFSQGWTANLIWADRYKEAKSAKPGELSLESYLETHGPREIADRIAHGTGNVLWHIPVKHLGYTFYFLAAGGILLSLMQRNRAAMVVLVFMFIQMAPLIWTNLSNPSNRVAVGPLVPFGFYYIGYLVSAVQGLSRHGGARRSAESSVRRRVLQGRHA